MHFKESEPEMQRLFVFNADRLSYLPEFLSWFDPAIQAGTVRVNFIVRMSSREFTITQAFHFGWSFLGHVLSQESQSPPSYLCR